MDLYQVMRTTFAARDFTDDPLPDEILHRILDNARFAPSGGNRQGWRVIVVRDAAARQALAELAAPGAKRYLAQMIAGESPMNTIHPSGVDDAVVEQIPVPPFVTEPLLKAPVVLVLCVDLAVVASFDSGLDRIGVVSGASIYPFAWNILLAARNEGFGGVITTFAVAREPEVQRLLGIPPQFALAGVMPLGRPVRQLTKLRRKAVEEFTTLDRFDGAALAARA